ncbi:MAG: peptide chain release factor N(5)-glutamine methyltransferase [Desulfovibrio sp.]|nr:peptide chain release factor N(5)-glutamine methyltransferase [Desulfovibrio sp.]
MRVREFRQLAGQRLQMAHRDSPRLSADLLLCLVLGCNRVGLYLEEERELSKEEEGLLSSLLEKREGGVPMAYLTGEREFYGRPFHVSEHTLIPRPETEILVEQALNGWPAESPRIFADLGTGSGNIGLTIALERKMARGYLLDVSRRALVTARRNQTRFSLEETTLLLEGSFSQLPFASESLDLIVANPPYIGHGERHRVMEEVLRYEPESALFAEDMGLASLRAIITGASPLLKKGGRILLEHGDLQGNAVRNMLSKSFTDIETIRDLAGRERVSLGVKV